MQDAGGELVRHYRELAFMGFLEAASNTFKIIKFLRECKSDILKYKPDVIILVDYAGFNLRIAKWAKAAEGRGFTLVPISAVANRPKSS